MAKLEAFPVDLIAIHQSRNLNSLQRFYVSPEFENCAFIGKWSTLKLNDGSSCVCRGFIKPILQKNACLLDDSVILNGRTCTGGLGSERKIVEISPIQSTSYIKKIGVTVVVSSIVDRNRFMKFHKDCHELTKNVLKLFVLIKEIEVNLSGFDVANNFGAVRVVVEDLKPNGPGKVVSSTELIVKKVLTLNRYEQMKESSNVCLAGAHRQFEELRNFLSFKHHSHSHNVSQVLIVGPSGSGKKTFVKEVARSCQALLIVVDCTELLSPEPGRIEKILRDRFEDAKQLTLEGPVVVLFLRLETIASRPGRVLTQLNNLLDECQTLPRLTVIGTTCNQRSLHESVTMASRLHHTVYIGLPSEDERTELWKAICPRELAPDVFRDLSKQTPSYSVADIALVLKRVDLFKESASDDQYLSYLIDSIRATEPSVMRGELGYIKTLDSSSTPVGGLTGIKRILEQAIFWPLSQPDLFRKFNLKPTKGVLLYGPPGCAKTSLARTLATSSKITFLAVSAADLYSPFVGESEQIIANLFRRARAASPSCLFIDEIDALVGRRGDKQKNIQERLLTSFLIEMDGIGISAADAGANLYAQVIVIGATNRPDSLDSAILRPGRLDKLIYVPPPDFKDRLSILQIQNEKAPLSKDTDLEYIARQTELFSGADLGSLSREAALQAMAEYGPNVGEINSHHWTKALNEIKPSLSSDQVRWYADFRFGL